MRKKFVIIATHVGIGTEIITILKRMLDDHPVIITTADRKIKIEEINHFPDFSKMVTEPYKNIPIPIIETLDRKIYFDKEPSKFISRSKNNYKK